MPTTTIKYRSTTYTPEEFQGILDSFTPDQLTLFESLLCDYTEEKAQLEYVVESPLAVVRASGYYAGKLELLRLLLSQNTSRS